MKLTELSSVEIMKAENGVVIHEGHRYDKCVTFNSMLVFDSPEPFLEWAREFFPKQTE
jgi:hypothetical protein